MVVTRSQSRLLLNSSQDVYCDSNSANTPVKVNGGPGNSLEERLGRGCRVSREPPASYDSLYVTTALLQGGRKRLPEREIQINSRYPERDAARRAVLRMSSTINSLDDSAMLSNPRDTSGDDNVNNAEKSSAGYDSDCGVIVSQSRGKKHNGNMPKKIHYKRYREASIDSSITEESLREESHRNDKLEGEMLFDERTSSSSLSAECMSEEEALRISKNAKESTVKNLSINHYLQESIQDAVVDNHSKTKKDKRKDKSNTRQTDNLFLGFDEVHDGTADCDFPGKSENLLALGDITPLNIDTSVSFEQVGGLPGHVVMLREMVLFPLLYPELLRSINLTPPRGVLFVGPPGTGKTLMARALANEAASCAQRKIAFFMRKGADILSKWVGESERQLSLLFQEARRRQPSIIFFDEIDGLVPVRHAKTEQSQAALVSTLLALIDGLDDRGQVIVIGATNRPDTIDPALRRPGRLDRELYFPIPDAAARRHILSIVMRPMLPEAHPDRNMILEELVTRCEGWSGAEIHALCREAGLNRLRTFLPQLYTTSKKLQVPTKALTVQKEDFLIAAHRIKSSVRRGVVSTINSLEEHFEHLLYSIRSELISYVAKVWPSAAAAIASELRDCGDIDNAVRELCSFSVPRTAQPMLLFLAPFSSENSYGNDASQFLLERVAVALTKSLPSLRSYTLHLPNLAVDRESLPAMMAGTMNNNVGFEGNASLADDYNNPHNSCFFSGHIYSSIMAFQRLPGPFLVILQGLDVWLAEYGLPLGSNNNDSCDNGVTEADEDIIKRQKHMESLCYYLNFFRDSDVLVIVPTLHVDVCFRFFGGGRLNTQLRRSVFKVLCTPTEDDLRRFLSYMFRMVELALLHHVPVVWEELPESPLSPLPLSLEEVSAARRAMLELWRRVEYRRRQLRHALTKWVSQFINSRKFSLFFSADLDFTPSHSLYEEWRSHTQGRRIGLCDVLNKLENEEYTCLSQYHDDIDMLVRNIRSFFRTRSIADQKYRSRALELKEATVLNLYKFNRKVVLFCERYKHLAEPDASPSSSLQEGAENRKGKPLSVVSKQKTGDANWKRKPARRYYHTRRRRRRRRRLDSSVSGGTANDILNTVKASQSDDIRNSSGFDKLKKGNIDEVTVVSANGSIDKHMNDGGNGVLATESDVNGFLLHIDATKMDALILSLRGLSFLHLHHIFQAAMSLLDERLKEQRKQQQCVSVTHSPGAAVDEVASFFYLMMMKALQTCGVNKEVHMWR